MLIIHNNIFEPLPETCYEHALDHLETARPEEKNGGGVEPTETPD